MERRLLAALALVLLLAGCGKEDGRESTSPPSQAPSSVALVPFTEVAILSGTAAGGSSEGPVRVDTPEALDAFVAQFERPGLGEEVRAAVAGAEVPEGHVLVAAVVAIGCDVPPGVSVDTTRGLTITPDKVASPLPECFAPVTSVAVLTVDASLM